MSYDVERQAQSGNDFNKGISASESREFQRKAMHQQKGCMIKGGACMSFSNSLSVLPVGIIYPLSKPEIFVQIVKDCAAPLKPRFIRLVGRCQSIHESTNSRGLGFLEF